jgi:hypothetical protein
MERGPQPLFGNHVRDLLRDFQRGDGAAEPQQRLRVAGGGGFLRGLMKVAITIAILVVALPVALNPKTSPDTAKIASGFVGTVIGWWAG